MTRRLFAGLTLGSAASMALPKYGERCYGVASMDPCATMCWIKSCGGTVLLDGREIRCVKYVDTERGIVRTLDVMRDGSTHFAPRLVRDGVMFPGREVELPPDNVAVETLRGVVELYAPLVPTKKNTEKYWRDWEICDAKTRDACMYVYPIQPWEPV